MKDLRIITVAVLLLLSRTALVYAEGAGIEWDVLDQEANDLYRQGKYDRAVVVAQKALEVAEQNVGPDHADVAESLNILALLYYTQGDYAKAEPLYKRSLAIKEKALGPDHPDVAKELGVGVVLGTPLQQGRLAVPREEWIENPPDWMDDDLRTRFESLYAIHQETGISLAMTWPCNFSPAGRIVWPLAGACNGREAQKGRRDCSDTEGGRRRQRRGV